MKYRIGNYICPRKVMSSDCVYDGKSSRLNYVSDTQETPIPKNNITPFKGITSDNAGHHHTYKVNRSGHVTIDYAYHPDLPEIKHKHHYVGKWPTGYVTRDKSSCYPCNMRNPKTKKRENGVYEHSHNLTEQINQGTGRTSSSGQSCYCECSTSNLPIPWDMSALNYTGTSYWNEIPCDSGATCDNCDAGKNCDEICDGLNEWDSYFNIAPQGYTGMTLACYNSWVMDQLMQVEHFSEALYPTYMNNTTCGSQTGLVQPVPDGIDCSKYPPHKMPPECRRRKLNPDIK